MMEIEAEEYDSGLAWTKYANVFDDLSVCSCAYLCVCVAGRQEPSPWVQGRDRELLHRHTEQQSSVKWGEE